MKHFEIISVTDKVVCKEINPHMKPDPSDGVVKPGSKEWFEDKESPAKPTWAAVFKHNYEQSLAMWQKREKTLKEYEVILPTYCQSEIEGGKACVFECDHCLSYYLPIKRDKFRVGDYISGEIVERKVNYNRIYQKNI